MNWRSHLRGLLGGITFAIIAAWSAHGVGSVADAVRPHESPSLETARFGHNWAAPPSSSSHHVAPPQQASALSGGASVLRPDVPALPWRCGEEQSTIPFRYRAPSAGRSPPSLS